MIVGPSYLVLKVKSNLMEQFECNDCGLLTEYIGNKIERIGEDAIQFAQTVLTHSYEDKFKLGNRCYNTPAQPGMVLMHPVEGKEALKPEDQTTLRSGVGNLMYKTQYSRPDIAQAVQHLGQYMSCGNSKMLEAMKRCMRYVLCTREAGLLLKPSQKWNGSTKHQLGNSTWTMQRILRQDAVALGMLCILKMHQRCIEVRHRRWWLYHPAKQS
jgi:hypothetical protein